MSTKSAIGRKNADGTVTYVTNRFDGYLAHTGVMLLLYYSDRSVLDELLSLGDISILGPVIGVEHTPVYNSTGKDANYTVFLKRDCKKESPDLHTKVASLAEFLTQPPTDTDLQDFYLYLYDEGEWFVTSKKARGFGARDCLDNPPKPGATVENRITWEVEMPLQPLWEAVKAALMTRGKIDDLGIIDIDFNDHKGGPLRVLMREIFYVLADLDRDAWSLSTDKATYPVLHVYDAAARKAIHNLVMPPVEMVA